MKREVLLCLSLAILAAIIFAVPGCDKLVTENNNIVQVDSTLGEDCLRCHSDDDNLIIQPRGQWENSAHHSADLIEATIKLNGENFVTNECGPLCHTNEGFIAFTKNGDPGLPTAPSIITCYTCHMPHTGDYGDWRIDTLRGLVSPYQLGNGLFYDMGKSNMCVNCHEAVATPPFGSTPITLYSEWGPHFSPQADVVSGTGGNGFDVVSQTVTHTGLTTHNGCLACHFGSGVGYKFGEHTFRLEDKETGQQYVENCNVAGCHNTTPVTDFYNYSIIDSITTLASNLKDSLLARDYLVDSGSTYKYFTPSTTIPATAAKILYNYLLYEMDGSRGVHNPVYMRELLTASINRLDSLPPLAAFTASTDTACFNTTVSFTNHSSGDITSYEWDFGDNSPAVTDPNTDHVFAAGDQSYTVSLYVTGPGGTDTATADIYIVGPPAAAFAAEDSAGCNTLSAVFADSSKNAETWAWDFGDGIGTSIEQNPTYDYTTPGAYTVRLIVTGQCGAGVDTLIKSQYINVFDATPVAAFEVDSATAPVSHEFIFTDQSTDVASWEWRFGDGSEVVTTPDATHTYENPGTYTVWLKVTNPCGVDSTSVGLNVLQASPGH